MLNNVITPEMHYDDWARAYDGDVQGWDYHAPDRLLERAEHFLRRHPFRPRLLDVGIGTGLFSEKCKAIRSDLRVSGIDISAKMLGVCARKAVADELTRVDISSTAFPYPDNSFDVVAASGVMENVSNIDNAVREMARVAKPGGLVLFTYIPTAKNSKATREEKTMGMRPGRTQDGKFVMGKLTMYRHGAEHIGGLTHSAGLITQTRDRFVGYRTYVVMTVEYDLYAGRKSVLRGQSLPVPQRSTLDL